MGPPFERPHVDIVVPVAAAAADVHELVERLRELQLAPGDSLRVVDNRGVGAAGPDYPEIVVAGEVASSYHARNAGARLGSAQWLLFLDADVVPVPDLLERLFDPAPGDDVGVLAGAVVDEPAPADAPAAIRYAFLKQAMSQETTLAHGRWAFAQTANCAVRRRAFEELGGFAERVRSGGDADLCWRLAAAGWRLEHRTAATVVHRNRRSVPAMLAQRVRHGSGAAWLGRRHPGALPRRAGPGLAWWATRRLAAGIAARARGDRDAALLGTLDGPAVWAFELGRLIPNRPLRRGRQR